MNCKYIMALLLCFCLIGCTQNVQQNSVEEKPEPQTTEHVDNEDKTDESTDNEEAPEGMTVDEDAEYEVEEDSGYEIK